MKKKVIFFTNIKSNYRQVFFNLLGQKVDLTVVFEAEFYGGVPKSWHGDDENISFRSVVLSEGVINERRINISIIKYLFGKYDFLVFTNYGYATELFAILIAILFRKKFLLEFDGLTFGGGSFFKKFIKGLIFSSAQKILIPDINLLSEKYRHKGVEYPFSSVLESDRLTELSLEQKKQFRSVYGIHEDAKVLLFVGQFIHRKGIDVLLDSLNSLEFNGLSNLVVIIAGDTPSDDLVIESRSGKCEIIFPGFLVREKVIEYMILSDFLVLPTREDVWGLVVNEALSLGLPVVTTDKCNAGNYFIKNGFNGFVFESENHSQLSKLIERLCCTAGLLEKMASNALVSSSNHTIQSSVEFHEKFFTK